MFPTKENIANYEKELSNDFFQPYNIARLGNMLIENFVLEREFNSLKIMLYLAKIDTEIQEQSIIQSEGQELIKFHVNFSELCKYCNLDPSTIRKNLKEIDNARIRYYNKDENMSYSKSIFPTISIHNNMMEIHMYKDLFGELKKTLHSIKDGSFTQIKFLDRLMNLKSYNAFRMFVLLNRIRDFKYQHKILSLEELNGYFGLNYSSLNDFNKNVLTSLSKELNGIIPFSYEPVYEDKPGKGRKPLSGYKIIYKDFNATNVSLIDNNTIPTYND